MQLVEERGHEKTESPSFFCHTHHLLFFFFQSPFSAPWVFRAAFSRSPQRFPTGPHLDGSPTLLVLIPEDISAGPSFPFPPTPPLPPPIKSSISRPRCLSSRLLCPPRPARSRALAAVRCARPFGSAAPCRAALLSPAPALRRASAASSASRLQSLRGGGRTLERGCCRRSHSCCKGLPFRRPLPEHNFLKCCA